MNEKFGLGFSPKIHSVCFVAFLDYSFTLAFSEKLFLSRLLKPRMVMLGLKLKAKFILHLRFVFAFLVKACPLRSGDVKGEFERILCVYVFLKVGREVRFAF